MTGVPLRGNLACTCISSREKEKKKDFISIKNKSCAAFGTITLGDRKRGVVGKCCLV